MTGIGSERWGRRALLKASFAGLSLPLIDQLARRSGMTTQVAEAATGEVQFTWSKAFDAGVVDLSSPTLYDVDGDGKQEIIGATTYWNDTKSGDSRDTGKAGIYILRPDGTDYQTIYPQGGGTIESSVAIGRLLGPSGDLYLVVGVGADSNMNKWVKNRGGIQAFRQNPATKLFEFAFEFNTRDDGPNPAATDKQFDPVFSTPCLVDVDGDGVLEVFFAGWDRWIYLIKPTPGGFVKVWDYHNADTIWSSGAAADVDGDGYPELFIGGDISIDPKVVPQTGFDGGFLYCFNRHGALLWRKDYPECIYSSPAIADVDGDGRLEVVVGTSDSFGLQKKKVLGNFVVCVDAATGSEKWRAKTNGHGWASPAIGDVLGKTNPLTGLPTLQVTCGSVVYNDMVGSDDTSNPSMLYLFDGDGTTLWAQRPLAKFGKTSPLRPSPIIANYDYNDDGIAEAVIMQPVFWDVVAFAGDGTQIQQFQTPYSLFATPVVGDADADGKLEMFAAGSHWKDASTGAVFRFNIPNKNGKRVNAAPQKAWPMFRRSPERTGLLPTSSILTKPITVTGKEGIATFAFMCGTLDGSSTTYDIVTRYLGFQTRGTAVSASSTPGWFTVTKLQPTIQATSKAVVQVTIDRSTMPQTTGVHHFSFEFVPLNPSTILSTKSFNLPVQVGQLTIAIPAAPNQRPM